MSALRAVTPQLVNGTSTEVSPAEVKKYKDIIRDQDAEMTQLREQLSKCQSDLEQIASEKESLTSKIQQLHDENTGRCSCSILLITLYTWVLLNLFFKQYDLLSH